MIRNVRDIGKETLSDVVEDPWQARNDAPARDTEVNEGKIRSRIVVDQGRPREALKRRGSLTGKA